MMPKPIICLTLPCILMTLSFYSPLLLAKDLVTVKEKPRSASILDLAKLNISCPTNTKVIPIVVHRTTRSKQIKAPHGLDNDQTWLQAQLKEAQALFGQVGLCFRFSLERSLPQSESIMKTRTQRTRLGRLKGRLHRGQIDLFIVNKLADVDVPNTEIRGVHWRDPKDRKNKRWIILSRIARPKVLAHELGHYFDLPHSKYPKSIMNKKPRKQPPMSKRGFVQAEYSIIQRAWKRMKKTGHLKPYPFESSKE